MRRADHAHDELILISEAGRIAGKSAATIRLWADLGKLPAVRTSHGIRLFRRGDVLRVAAERAQ